MLLVLMYHNDTFKHKHTHTHTLTCEYARHTHAHTKQHVQNTCTYRNTHKHTQIHIHSQSACIRLFIQACMCAHVQPPQTCTWDAQVGGREEEGGSVCGRAGTWAGDPASKEGTCAEGREAGTSCEHQIITVYFPPKAARPTHSPTHSLRAPCA